MRASTDCFLFTKWNPSDGPCGVHDAMALVEFFDLELPLGSTVKVQFEKDAAIRAMDRTSARFGRLAALVYHTKLATPCPFQKSFGNLNQLIFLKVVSVGDASELKYAAVTPHVCKKTVS